MSNRIAFFGCRRYEWMKPLALATFRKAWPNCPYPVDWVSDDHDAGWVPTFKRYAEQHKSDRVLVMLDDYMTDAVNVPLLEIAFAAPFDCVRVCPCPGPTEPCPVTELGLFDTAQPYLVSLQPAVWSPMALADLLDDNWSPWEVEIEGSKRAAQRGVNWAGTTGRCVDHYDLAVRGVIQSDNLERATRAV